MEVERQGYLLATVHRAENTDDPARLRAILDAFAAIDEPIVFPLHPRTRQAIARLDDAPEMQHVRRIAPVGYLDMVQLEQSARLIMTDSGGIQKEAYWLGVPCVTLRDETEWVETVHAGWNVLAGAQSARILDQVRGFVPPLNRPTLPLETRSSERIVRCLLDVL